MQGPVVGSGSMSVLQLLIILAVLATLYWAAGHHSPTNHAENDEATSRGGVTHDTKETK